MKTKKFDQFLTWFIMKNKTKLFRAFLKIYKILEFILQNIYINK